ncbi:ABC transporter permease [Rubellicoccus peritrichatus]|uniref:ABC transporter permease subunit n=1 Tax=Rubellicoccus peritrichatus TaxID=3080537 RepID=A0AAQ3QSC9_9BACT|nr:ABC transporter permease subunit [Puniceicoccus sp. CR14]WOO40231.1 ABC transporter permease subunit [Puniceicoccus sp. CR14]
MNTKRIWTAVLLSVGFFLAFLAIWHVTTHVEKTKADSITLSSDEVGQLTAAGMSETDMQIYAEKGLKFDQIEQIANMGLTHEDLEMAGGIEAFGFTTGGAAEEATTGFPSPALVWKEAYYQLSDPFYDRGPNDKGIGTQLKYSLFRVGTGFLLAVIVAVPLGFVIGMFPLLNMALMPYIQVLKPISPLAWLPVALYLIKDSEQASIFVIFVCSIWPMLINTAYGVSSTKKDWINIAKTLELSQFKTAWSVVLPAASPTILTGMRISLSIAWLVIVAAEMVIGGIGVGYFVWNEWNGLNLASMIFAIFIIGVVGLILDLILGQLVKTFTYQE